MNYTYDMFKEFLICEINNGYNPVRMANNAFSLYLKYAGEIPADVYEKLRYLMIMGEGSEFELAEETIKEWIATVPKKENAQEVPIEIRRLENWPSIKNK
jgi:hypothetical protein